MPHILDHTPVFQTLVRIFAAVGHVSSLEGAFADIFLVIYVLKRIDHVLG